MKILLLFLFTFCFANVYSQNVGINKTNPAYPLDVNGNVNVSGNVLMNGTAGTNGQVLMTNGTGNTVWASLAEFKYVVSFAATTSTSFVVPADVTRIAVEAWGGGGGGASGGGGAGGMYILSIQDVTPGQTITINIGQGGPRATSTSSSGGNGTVTSVTNGTWTINALGGSGAGTGTPGFGALNFTVGSRFMQYTGQPGYPNDVNYAQKNSTTFVIIRKYGDGGASGPDYSRRSIGQTVVYNENTNAIIENNFTSFAPVPGGGGGGGTTSNTDGANGMVVIRY